MAKKVATNIISLIVGLGAGYLVFSYITVLLENYANFEEGSILNIIPLVILFLGTLFGGFLGLYFIPKIASTVFKRFEGSLISQTTSEISWKNLLKIPVLVSFVLTIFYVIYVVFFLPNSFLKLTDVISIFVSSFPLLLIISYCLLVAVKLLKSNIQFEEAFSLMKMSYFLLVVIEVVITLFLAVGAVYSIMVLTGGITLKYDLGLTGLVFGFIPVYFIISLIVAITTFLANNSFKKQSKAGYYLTWIVSLLLVGVSFLPMLGPGLLYGAFLIPFLIFLFKFGNNYTKIN